MSKKSQKKEESKNLKHRIDFITSQIRENRIEHEMLARELKHELDLYKVVFNKNNKNDDTKKVLAEHKRLTQNAYDMVEKKGADYNRKQQLTGDTLFNLTVAHQLGIVDSTTKSILVRISDKIMRLISLTSNPKEEAEIKDERISDTIEDTINYLVYLYCKYQEARKD